MRGTIWRLVLLTALLAIYPAAMLAFHFLSPARAGSEIEVDLDLRAEILHDGPELRLETWLLVDNRSLEALEIEQVVLDVFDQQQPELSLILARASLRTMTGSAGRLRPSERREVGPIHLELPPGATRRHLQVSVTLRSTDGGRPREVHQGIEVWIDGAGPAPEKVPD